MLLFYASYKDVKTRQISNWLCLAVCVLAAVRIYFNRLSLLSAVIAAIFAAAPFFIADFIKLGCVGGGDIKLLFSAGLMLGTGGVGIMLFISCIAFLAMSIIKKFKNKTNEKSAPFAPYISIGAVISYIILLL